jgi:hypothetical protein
LVQNNIVISSNPEKTVDTLLISDIIKNPKNWWGFVVNYKQPKKRRILFVFNSGMYLGAGLSNPRHRQLVKLDKKGGYKMSVP